MEEKREGGASKNGNIKITTPPTSIRGVVAGSPLLWPFHGAGREEPYREKVPAILTEVADLVVELHVLRERNVLLGLAALAALLVG
ncbi:MAG: hypothetical protein Q7R85_01315 [bacterium]|nr:hypothetical protein [bacterium]